jgi:hypothetical protein
MLFAALGGSVRCSREQPMNAAVTERGPRARIMNITQINIKEPLY